VGSRWRQQQLIMPALMEQWQQRLSHWVLKLSQIRQLRSLEQWFLRSQTKRRRRRYR
jgi:hypothetical protein